MFWESVLGGLAVCTHWEVWLALVVFGVLWFAWLTLIGMLMGDSEPGARMATGFLLHMIGGAVFQSLLLGGLILVLTPLMLGGDDVMPLAFFTTFAWPILKACFLALVVSFIIALLPIVGRLVTHTPGLDAFIQGIIIFRSFSATFIEPLLEHTNLQVSNLYPGFWSSVGYFVLAITLVCVALFIFAGVRTLISREPLTEKNAPYVVGTALVYVLSILPLFMYANHVTLAIQKSAG